MANREGNRNFVAAALTDQDLENLDHLVIKHKKTRSTLIRLALRRYVAYFDAAV